MCIISVTESWHEQRLCHQFKVEPIKSTICVQQSMKLTSKTIRSVYLINEHDGMCGTLVCPKGVRTKSNISQPRKFYTLSLTLRYIYLDCSKSIKYRRITINIHHSCLGSLYLTHRSKLQ